MSDEWKELHKIPQLTLRHGDYWEYRCTVFADIVCVEYWEDRQGESIKESEFNVPTFCAKQLFEELAKLAANASEE